MQHGNSFLKARWVRLVAYPLFFLLFALLPLSLVENGIYTCPSALWGGQCPGCGVTRAMTALMKGDFATAYSLNGVFCLTVFPGAVFCVLQDVVMILLGRPLSFLEYLCGCRGGLPGGK